MINIKEVWNTIQGLSDIRAKCNIFNPNDIEKYHTLSLAIKHLRLLINADSDAEAKAIIIPKWCEIGKTIEWHNPSVTGYDWVHEQILGYSDDGFWHGSAGDINKVYHGKFSEYGKTIKEVGQATPSKSYWVNNNGNGYVCAACKRFVYEKEPQCSCGCIMEC